MGQVKTERRTRVLLGKIGLDGHDRGIKVVALGLRNAGFEILYTGLHAAVEELVQIAVQEDVDIIGLSMLSGAHDVLVPRVMDSLRKEQVESPVVVGGFIPDEDIPALLACGVALVIQGDTPIAVIVEKFRSIVATSDSEHDGEEGS